MFITLQNGAMLNLFWLQDCFTGKHDSNIVIFYLINGTKLNEVYTTDQAATDRVTAVHLSMATASYGVNLKKVDSLPETGEFGVIYLVPKSAASEDNIYDEYIWTAEGEWERIGDTTVDLTNYYTKAESDTLLNTKENIINKVTSLDSSATDNEYPSAKCVYDIIGNVETLLGGI